MSSYEASHEAVIASIVNNDTGLTTEQLLQSYLEGIPVAMRLQRVQDLLLAISEADSLIAEIASNVWVYIMSHRLWESKYPSLEAFKDSIAYGVSIDQMLKRNNILNIRQRADCRGIVANWGSSPFEALPADLLPPKYSRDFFQHLHRLSKICSLDKAVTLLKEQVHQRYWVTRRARRVSYITLREHIIVTDITHVYQKLKLQIDSENNELEDGYV